MAHRTTAVAAAAAAAAAHNARVLEEWVPSPSYSGCAEAGEFRDTG